MSALYSVSTADSSGEVGQIWARTKAEALKEARRLYGTHGDRDSFGRKRKVAVYVRKLHGNPSRPLTKAQKKANASKRSKEKRVAEALKKFLHAQNPAVKTAGASVVRLKGGVIKITPIKAKARGRG